jgi:hypothetical protein
MARKAGTRKSFRPGRYLMRVLRRACAATALACVAACSREPAPDTLAQLPPAPVVPTDASSPDLPEDLEALLYAARRAWSFVDANYNPATGFVRTVASYPAATAWDIASGIAALHSAHRLGLLEDAEYVTRMRRVLATLASVPLFADGAFNKKYATASGLMLDRADAVTARGIGWSVTDLGRLLVWLRIVAVHDPAIAADVDAVVARLDRRRLVRNGMLHGADMNARGRMRTYPEGWLGYEQYAARGFALWHMRAEHALDYGTHSIPVTVLDQRLIADRRPRACLTSEPFVLMGLELGWDDPAARLAHAVLAVQEERHRRTGILTVASEDASAVPPHYFYYSCVFAADREFVITSQSGDILPDGPRTISTKAAFAWYALVPSAYTRLALEHVTSALEEHAGWPSTLDEQTLAINGVENVNTAAVILEAVLYITAGRRPLIDLP